MLLITPINLIYYPIFFFLIILAINRNKLKKANHAAKTERNIVDRC